jgi:hypothetical protein
MRPWPTKRGLFSRVDERLHADNEFIRNMMVYALSSANRPQKVTR